MTTSLFVKYLYKGKPFSVAFSEGHRNKHFLIGNKFIVGSDPNLLWQVFNQSFPKQHELIIKDGERYYFNLLKSFSIEVKKNNQEIDLNDLKNQGILKDNKLYVNNELEGKIIVDENTEFEFKFITIKDTLNDEEKKLVALFHQTPKDSKEQKITKYSLGSIVILIVILASIIGWKYEPPKKVSIYDRSLSTVEGVVELSVKESFTRSTPQADLPSEEGTEEPIDTDQAPTDNATATRKTAGKLLNIGKTSGSSSGNIYDMSTSSGATTDLGSGSLVAMSSSVSGFSSGSKRATNFEGLSVNTGSDLSEAADRLRRKKGDATQSGAIASGGIKASELGNRQVSGFGDARQAALTGKDVKFGDGKISPDELGITGTSSEDITGTAAVLTPEDEPLNLTDPQKESYLRDWFNSKMKLELDEIYNRYALRKPMSGKVTFRFKFTNNIVTNIKAIGRGSIGDKTFLKALEDAIKGKRVPGMADFSGSLDHTYGD